MGNQYFRTRGVFGQDLKPADFLYWVLEDARPGTVETSIIATDNNNNPSIINAIYNLAARLEIPNVEQMGPAAAAFPPGGVRRNVPHILMDGADSIGVPGALDRVFVNIGTFGEEWLRCHNPIIGGADPETLLHPQRTQALRLLASNGSAHAQPGQISHRCQPPHATAGCPRRRGLPHR